MSSLFIPFKTFNHLYIYDMINGNIILCSPLTFELYSFMFQKHINHIEYGMLLNNEKFKEYSKENIHEAICVVNKQIDYIENNTNLELQHFGVIRKEDILKSLGETKQIVLEVTRSCNLQCVYCCYGSLYKKEKLIKLENKQSLQLDYLRYLLKLGEEVGRKKLIISFYGGEPLLNMKSIEAIVAEVSKYSLEIKYTITTNGVLLNRYIDFLVEHNFTVYVSSDGNAYNNSYRVFSNGQESFTQIENNIKWVQERYPSFFDKNIVFLSVLHNRNDIITVNKYFSSFNKETNFSNLSRHNVRKDKLNVIRMMQHEGEYKQDEKEYIKAKYPVLYKEQFDLERILRIKYLSYKIHSNTIGLVANQRKYYPGQTCYLFQNRVFVTLDGFLLPCEHILRKYSLGRIVNGKIRVYTNKVNRLYTKIANSFMNSCDSCIDKFHCNRCFFQSDNICEDMTCFNYLEKAQQELKYLVSKMEVEI